MQDDLDNMLARRAVPQVGAHLAERIIAQAHPRPQVAPGFLRELMMFFQEDILVPRPALAFSVMLVLGISTGMMVDIQTQVTPEEMAQSLDVQDTLSSGEFL